MAHCPSLIGKPLDRSLRKPLDRLLVRPRWALRAALCGAVLVSLWGGAISVAAAETESVPSAVPRAVPELRRLFHWPVTAPHVLRPFAPPPQHWLAGHRGVDLAARAGSPVRAAGAGRVTFAGRVAGRGVVTVTHGVLRTTYEPVTARLAAGTRVEVGDVIGTLENGVAHCTGSSCLHWGLLRGNTYLDPLLLIRRGPSRLFPLWSERDAQPSRVAASAGPHDGFGSTGETEGPHERGATQPRPAAVTLALGLGAATAAAAAGVAARRT